MVSSVILRKFLQQCWEFSPEFFKTFLNKIFVTTLSLSMFLKGAQWGLKVQGQPQQFFFRATLTSFSSPSQPGADTGEGESKGRRPPFWKNGEVKSIFWPPPFSWDWLKSLLFLLYCNCYQAGALSKHSLINHVNFTFPQSHSF